MPKGKNKSGKLFRFRSPKEHSIFEEMKNDYLSDPDFGLTIREQVKHYWDISRKDDGQASYVIHEKKQRRILSVVQTFLKNIQNAQDYFQEWEKGDQLFLVACGRKVKGQRKYQVLKTMAEFTGDNSRSINHLMGRAYNAIKRAMQGKKKYPELASSITKVDVPQLKEGK